MRVATLEVRIGRQSDQFHDARDGFRTLQARRATVRQHGFGQLPPDANARVERRARVLRHEGDPVAAQLVALWPRHGGKDLSVDADLTLLYTHRYMAKAEQLQRSGAVAAAGLS